MGGGGIFSKAFNGKLILYYESFFKQRRDMIRVVGTWENTAAAKTGVKEIDRRIIVMPEIIRT